VKAATTYSLDRHPEVPGSAFEPEDHRLQIDALSPAPMTGSTSGVTRHAAWDGPGKAPPDA
jgi:hypothetical protein